MTGRVHSMNNSKSEPLWAQVLSDLRRRIAEGSFEDSFPTDEALVRHYGVSRHTVREAVRHLVAEGLVERRRRTGSRLRPTEFEQPLGSLYSLFREIEAQGVAQTSQVRALELRHDAKAAAQLALPAKADLVYLERVRMAGGSPLALDRVWLPYFLASGILDADFSRTALYDELMTRCGAGPVVAKERIRPVVPSPAEAAVLAMDTKSACFAIERASWTDDGQALEWRIGLVRGDRYAFVAEWTGGARKPELPGRWTPEGNPPESQARQAED